MIPFQAAATTPSLGITGFLMLALAATAFAVAFLRAQRHQGQPPAEVKEALQHARALEGLGAEVRSLREAAARSGAPAETVREMDETLQGLEAATRQLKRAAEHVL